MKLHDVRAYFRRIFAQCVWEDLENEHGVGAFLGEEAIGLFKRAGAWFGEGGGGFEAGGAQKAVPVAFNGAFLPSTAGMAIVDGAYRGLSFLASP